MLTNNKWQQEHSKKNKKIYESSKKLIAKRKDEKGKTKTELIKEFIDYDGDKWKYLMDHPLTRMALAVSGEPIFESLLNLNVSMLSYSSPIVLGNNNPGSFAFTAPLVVPQGSAHIMYSNQAILFPIQFGIRTLGNGSNYAILSNIAFSTLIYSSFSGLPTTLGTNGNPFNLTGANGFSIRIPTVNQTSTTFSGMTYASTGATSANIASLSETLIPGLASAANFFLNPSATVYFRFYSSGNKIGWSTDGLTWTYWTPPTPYPTRGLYLNLALSAINVNQSFAYNPGYFLLNVPGTLVNQP